MAFTNFEMAILSDEDRCGVPADYQVSFGEPRLPAETRLGNTGGPHAVAPDVMDFLADRGFNLMSLSNNHAYDLGDCGIAATQAAATAHEVAVAAPVANFASATPPACPVRLTPTMTFPIRIARLKPLFARQSLTAD